MFVVHVKVVKDRAVLLELVLVCSVLVFLHSFPIYETYQKQLNYEVKEIE